MRIRIFHDLRLQLPTLGWPQDAFYGFLLGLHRDIPNREAALAQKVRDGRAQLSEFSSDLW